MQAETKQKIYDKIEELQEIAKAENCPMILFFKEDDEKNGRHLAAYGSGKDVAEHEPNLLKVFKHALNF